MIHLEFVTAATENWAEFLAGRDDAQICTECETSLSHHSQSAMTTQKPIIIKYICHNTKTARHKKRALLANDSAISAAATTGDTSLNKSELEMLLDSTGLGFDHSDFEVSKKKKKKVKEAEGRSDVWT